MGNPHVTLDRRQFVTRTGIGALAVGLGAFPLSALAETVDVAELMKPGALPENALGAEDAPVTVVEYASMTCGHCATFHKQAFPHLKKEYIDQGKVRFIFREFPLDPVAAAAFMLARCAPEGKYFDVVDLLFEDQRAWAFTDNPYNSLLNFAKQIGFTQESFDACLKDQTLLDGINGIKDRAAQEFGVSSTPTFFFNGKKESGAQSIEQLDTAIGKLL